MNITDKLLGMPTEHGSKIYKNDKPEIDAGSVVVLRKAGCLIFGKSSGRAQLPPFLMTLQAKQPQPSLLPPSLAHLPETPTAPLAHQEAPQPVLPLQ
jgi:Asp-tRNA(Asn)/Glu-tRNA(Gln) amidotransferase A subunit family amidase